MEIMRVITKLEEDKVYGLMGNIDITTNNSNYFIVNDYKFKGTIEEYLASQKSISALKMVMLNEQYLTKDISELSSSEIKRIILAKALISNKKYIILDYFDKDLTQKEQEEFKRLFKRLATNYHKTILLFTNNITFIWDIAEYIIYLNNNELKTFPKKDFGILNYVDKPNIIKIIELIRSKNISINDYKNTADLLKAIYRIKEKEVKCTI